MLRRQGSSHPCTLLLWRLEMIQSFLIGRLSVCRVRGWKSHLWSMMWFCDWCLIWHCYQEVLRYCLAFQNAFTVISTKHPITPPHTHFHLFHMHKSAFNHIVVKLCTVTTHLLEWNHGLVGVKSVMASVRMAPYSPQSFTSGSLWWIFMLQNLNCCQ